MKRARNEPSDREPRDGDEPILVAPYGREKLQATYWNLLLAGVGLLEVVSNWFRIGSFAAGWLHSVPVGVGLFAAGAVFISVVIGAFGSRVRPWMFTQLSEAPTGVATETPGRTALRVCINQWPFVIGLAGGLALPPAGGFGGGCALAWALSSAWELRRTSRAERRQGWRVFWVAPPRLRLLQPHVPTSAYYRLSK